MTSDIVSGLWSVDFISGLGSFGSGIIVFQNGQILGGDDSYFYAGEYTLQHNQIFATLAVKHYKGPRDNIFGPVSEIALNIEGAVSGHFLMGNGQIVNSRASMSFKMKLLKKI